MYRNFILNILFLFLLTFCIFTLSFALLLPETPDGKIGKNYQLYGVVSTGLGITKKDFNYSTNYYVFGLRSNFNSDFFDFGLFYNTFSIFMGLSADIKYGFTQNKNFSCAFDFSVSKPFIDGWLIKTGLASNLTILHPFELIFASYYIYSFSELKTDEISFPCGNAMYFYTGLEFQPPFLIDNTIALGCGYLHMPNRIPETQKFFNQFYINIFTRYAFNEPQIDRKSNIAKDIVKNELERNTINKYVLLAKELIQINEYKKAILILSDGIYFYPDNFMLNYLLADCYYKIGEKKKAYIYFKKSHSINTTNFDLKETLINLEKEIKK